MDGNGNKEEYLLEDPEVQEIFSAVLTIVLDETDRGAVLIGADIVDKQLRKMFEEIMPAEMGKKSRKELLEGLGPLASLSSKSKIAYALRLIDRNLLSCIGVLRSIRNDCAHSQSEFRLKNERDRLRSMCNLGERVPEGINRLACEILVKDATAKILDAMDKLSEEIEDIPIKTPNDVVDYLSKSPHITDTLEKRRPRLEFGLGIIFISALVIRYRKRAVSRLGSQTM